MRIGRPTVLASSILALLAATACGSSDSGSGNNNQSPSGSGGALPDGGGAGEGGSGSSSGGTSSDSGAPDAAPAPGYPAPHAPLPQVDYNGGPIFPSPKVVTVTFDTDTTMRPDLETFDDTILTTPYWDAIRAGYCEGAGSTTCVGQGEPSTNAHVHVAAVPKGTGTSGAVFDSTDNPDKSDIQSWIKSNVANGTFKDADANTIYVVYFPQGTSVELENGGQKAQSCVNGGFGGYHNAVPITAGGKTFNMPYAIVPRCSDINKKRTDEQETTFSASHELIEAMTDPFVGIQQVGYYLNDAAWGTLGGGEVGDLCVDPFGLEQDTTTVGNFTVQRTWSNASAAASHNPCVPIPNGEVYFNVAPRITDPTGAIQLAVGQSTTIELDAFSDAQTTPWVMKAADLADLEQGSTMKGVLTFSLDIPATNGVASNVQNGTVAHLTVTLTGQPNFQGQSNSGTVNYEPFLLLSEQLNGTTPKAAHYWPVLVVAK